MKKLTVAEFAALGGWKETTFKRKRKHYEQKLIDKGFAFERITEGPNTYYLVEEEKQEANFSALTLSQRIEAIFGFKPRYPQFTYDYLNFWHNNPEEFEIMSDSEVAEAIHIGRSHIAEVREELTPTYIFPLHSGEYTYNYKVKAEKYTSEPITYEEYRNAQWAWTNFKREFTHELASRIGDKTPIYLGDTRYNNDTYTMDPEVFDLIVREHAKAKMLEVYGGYPTRTPKKIGSYNVVELREKLLSFGK